MKFLRCTLYMFTLGILCIPFGRLLAKIPFHINHFPLKETRFELLKKPYEKLKIRYWQNKVPDMSRVLTRLMPSKKLNTDINEENIKTMIRETCVAEYTHSILCILGLQMIKIWPGVGGIILTVVYIFWGNVPYILIQRYNRPRLQRLERKLKEKNESFDTKL